MEQLTRRNFLKTAGAAAGGLALAGPLQAFAGKSAAQAAPIQKYGPLINMGDIWLPRGFRYKIISTEGAIMSDGNPTPSMFDGMAAYDGPRGTTILIRNHENRERGVEIPVVVPDALRYDASKTGAKFNVNAGNTKLVVRADGTVLREFAILGGTAVNCAGGEMPWGSWVTSEEIFSMPTGGQKHGFNFEVDADANGPVQAVPIKAAGRFVHEAVSWLRGALYQTEDRRDNAAFYRYIPNFRPRRPGDLARSTGPLQALMIRGLPNFNTINRPTPTMIVGQAYPVEWTPALNPEPATDVLRVEAGSKGAALFDRQEGIWTGNGRVYFCCTSAGVVSAGQVFEYNPSRETLTLIYESPGIHELESPDNLVVAPGGDVLLCEDGDEPQFIRGITRAGDIYDFARTETRDSEFCGACFSPNGRTLFVNQQGDPTGTPNETGATYAITGPWARGGLGLNLDLDLDFGVN